MVAIEHLVDMIVEVAGTVVALVVLVVFFVQLMVILD
jgi:hypothetical protein